MRILLRNYNGEQYVWKKAEVKSATKFTLEDGRVVSQAEIVSISRDNRKKFVKCSACGEIIRNTPEAINEHKLKGTTSATCFGCKYMREMGSKQLSVKYTLQEDGSYSANVKKSLHLVCTATWNTPDINSENARGYCKFKQCATAEMKAIEDVFTKYPSAFDDMITVDKVLDNGFTERKECASRGQVEYKLKARNNIIAVVNKLNIVDCFVIDYRNHRITVVYSKKYDKLFAISSETYTEVKSIWFMPDTTFANIKAKIASLYN